MHSIRGPLSDLRRNGMSKTTITARRILGVYLLWMAMIVSSAAEDISYTVNGRTTRLRTAVSMTAYRMSSLDRLSFQRTVQALPDAKAVRGVNPAHRIIVYEAADAAVLQHLQRVQEKVPVFLDQASFWRVPVGEVIVCFHAAISDEEQQAVLQKHRLTKIRPIEGLPGVLVAKATSWRASLDGIERLQRHPAIKWAEPNFYGQTDKRASPNDPLFPNQWHLSNTGQWGTPRHYECDAPSAWDIQTGTTAIVVAVLDDAVQANHPDLNPAVVPGGYDFVDNVPDPSPKDPDPNNPENHGTAVAGVAVATGNNGLGVAGAGFGCGLLPIRMLNGDYAAHAQAILYASTNANIMNNSWGYPLVEVVRAAIDVAATKGPAGKGCLVVFALGNYTMHRPVSDDPAALPSVLAIGINNDIMRPTYADWGLPLDVTAASDGGLYKICTTDRTGSDGYNTNASPAGDYCNANDGTGFGGTSSASPLAAGIAALVYSRHPDAYALQIRKLLEQSTDRFPLHSAGLDYDPDTGWSPLVGYGALNAFKALSQELPPMDSNEPNNTVPEATPLFNARMQYGSIDPAGESDWFKISLVTTSELYCTTAGTTNALLQLYNQSQALLASSNGFDGLRRTCDPGEFYVQVQSANGQIVPAYGLDVSTYNFVDSQEPDNDPDAARDVSAWSLNRHTLWPTGDVDWVRFSVASNETFVGIETYGFVGDTLLRLYDSGTNLIAENDDTPKTSFSCIVTSLTAGTYFAAVQQPANDLVRAYTLQIRTTARDAYEPDDEPDQASVLTSGCSQVRTIFPARNADWAKITLPHQSALLLYLDWSSHALFDDPERDNEYLYLTMKLTLYDSQTNQLQQSRQNYRDVSAAIFTNNLAAGDYFVQSEVNYQQADDGQYASWYNLNAYIMPSEPRLGFAGSGSNSMVLSWPGDRYFDSAIESCTSLIAGNWSVQTNLPGDFQTMSWSLPQAEKTNTALYLRLKHDGIP